MIQFNLLPDIKLEFLKAKKQKRFVSVIAFFAASACLVGLVIMFSFVQGVQKKHLRDLDKDIKKYSYEIKAKPDVEKVLTIQNQLKSLPGLLESRPVVTRLFGYMVQVTPAKASISSLRASYVDYSMTISGNIDTLENVNKFVDTLKFTTFKTGDGTTSANAFTSVTLSSFSRTDTGTSYTINLLFDPGIFDGNASVILTVPNIISTRSTTEQPTQLFTGSK